jgi:4-hydroxybenzoate polyprenyltransferase
MIADDTPSAGRIALLVMTALAGYLAVFAANDLLDAPLDRRRLQFAGDCHGRDIDSAGSRHPLATGQLNVVTARAWVFALGIAAAILSTIINPVCTVLFVVAALLELTYCRLATRTPHKFILSGVMVAVGACAGWFAVREDADWALLGLLFLWMGAWEIGGRNIPNDWSDVDEDVHLGIKTVPVVFGYRTSGILILGFLLVTVLASIALTLASWPSFGAVGVAGVVLAGGSSLLWPSIRLVRDPRPAVALMLFNAASWYPVIVLIVLAVGRTARNLSGI